MGKWARTLAFWEGPGYPIMAVSEVPFAAGDRVTIMPTADADEAIRLLREADAAMTHDRMCSTCADDGCGRCVDCNSPGISTAIRAFLNRVKP